MKDNLKKRHMYGLGLMLAIVLLFSLAGCSTGGGGQTSESSTGGSGVSGNGEQSPSQAQDNELEPITFTAFFEDPSPNWNNMQDEVGKVITEKTGVTVDAEYAVSGVDRISLIAASGDYPDLISPKGSADQLVNAGAMIDLTELLEQHAPNLKEIYGEFLPRLRWSEEDPSIYFLPTYDGVGQQYFDAGGGFQLQHAVVQELGYPEIRTLQDFEDAIRTYKEKYPTIDGQETIGLSLLADDWRILISVTNNAFYVTGAPDDGEFYIDPDTFEATYHYRRPEEKEYFRWLNHMNATGLLDPESFVQKYDQYLAKISSGRVLALTDQRWQFQDGENALKAEEKYERGYGHYPVTLDETYVRKDFQGTGFMGGWGIGITTSNPNPVRAIQFLDWLASEEGQILRKWGIEGKHYDIVDGKRVIPEDVLDRKLNDAANFARTSGIGLYEQFSAKYGDGVLDSTGNYFTTNFPEQIVESYNEVEREVLANYGAQTWKDLFPSEDEFPVRPWGAAWQINMPTGSDLTFIFQRCEDIMKRRIPQAVLAEPDEFDDVWEQFMAELLDAGVEKMEEAYTELVKQKVAFWNE